VGISAVPFKTDPPLIVDGYTVLPSPVADKSVQLIARRNL